MELNLDYVCRSYRLDLKRVGIFLCGGVVGFAIDQGLENVFNVHAWFDLKSLLILVIICWIVGNLVCSFDKAQERVPDEEASLSRKVQCTLTATGNAEKLVDVFDELVDEEGDFSFDRCFPTPSDILSREDRASWRLNNWGCTGLDESFNPVIHATADLNLDNMAEVIPGAKKFSIEFVSTDGTPTKFVKSLAHDFPGIKFALSEVY